MIVCVITFNPYYYHSPLLTFNPYYYHSPCWHLIRIITIPLCWHLIRIITIPLVDIESALLPFPFVDIESALFPFPLLTFNPPYYYYSPSFYIIRIIPIPPDSPPGSEAEGNYKVLATDYTNYAVVYSCGEVAGGQGSVGEWGYWEGDGEWECGGGAGEWRWWGTREC